QHDALGTRTDREQRAVARLDPVSTERRRRRGDPLRELAVGDLLPHPWPAPPAPGPSPQRDVVGAEVPGSATVEDRAQQVGVGRSGHAASTVNERYAGMRTPRATARSTTVTVRRASATGRRASSTASTWARARGIPRQKCGPAPNHRCRTAASAGTPGSNGPASRQHEIVAMTTRSPGRTRTRPTVASARTD